ncbi:RluA family pseudouridine synthase [Brachyspira hyodysenteriae]|uniref:RluA family pseudouridine synthase n=1 Tax=Brachyspira hyodysenteriae TaxID=159 RepID=UPI000AA6DC93|nr:RluA family pseudouridine synthase [Brachyspira hyodysenteriae]MCZ9838438.1 RluA family pseudouridine synthase [Brachyspira hyodysenteriae]MCZ9849551.1 RluA family pseudouridine synthase [Brachyspira hyodysenteriae]MCZ9850093.1 RluA family pseudouridine synthase [Brachyspira hyodysenteriae]MCZ9861084.1 RluA family pseudouridine synthase [Brachyspira hyodysenteriae]MCZ9873565.1 RluA family pseudouridine synthase [Brachyspira hyodysenteriae]
MSIEELENNNSIDTEEIEDDEIDLNNSDNKKSFIITEDDIGKRLDTFISEKLNITRSQVKNYLTSIIVNDAEKKLSYSLKLNDNIIIDSYNIFKEKIDTANPIPENIDLDILYEDKYLLVINKPAGMSVHCSPSEMSGTLVNALLYKIKDFDFVGNKERAGIIHRLDKDTSGLMIIGKNANIVSSIQEQFKNRTIKKIYHAIVVGVLKDNYIEINLPIGRHHVYRKKMTVRDDGKEALTHIKVLKRFNSHTLIEINLKTGRTHQIRVHSSYKGFPVAGDKIYSKSFSKYPGLMLIAKKIEFMHPITKETLDFEIDYPDYFTNFLYSDNI